MHRRADGRDDHFGKERFMSSRLNPVTLEVIRNALPAVANEMAADMQRTSYNMMIYEIRDFCKDRVAHFKVPKYIWFVDDFPMTVTGKLQKFRMRDIAIEKLGLRS